MKVYLAADHAGLAMKDALVAFVRDELVHDVEDCGAYQLEPQDDYPEIIARAAKNVAADVTAGFDNRAIVLGGSGQGEAIVANRFVGVRAAVFYGGNLELVQLAREHNDANVLSLGARFVGDDEAKAAVHLFLETPFSGEERHVRRIREIDELS